MKKKLKIAIYSGAIPSTSFIENLIDEIANTHIIFLFGKQKTRLRYSKKSIRSYPIYSIFIHNFIVTKWRVILLILKYPKRFFILLKELKTKQGFYSKFNWLSRYVPVLLYLPDIFHVQWAKDLEYWMFLQELEVKIVLSLRGAHINYSPIANKQLAVSYKNNFPKVDAFHAVSIAIEKEVQKYNADPKKIKVIHSIIPKSTLELFRLPEKRNEMTLRIISVGRHHWKKGYSIALDACKILKEKKIPFVYTIIAQGEVPEELLIQRNELDLLDEVVFEKGVEQTTLFKCMQKNDVLLLPSLEEGIANVVLEAMAIGVPVISTNCGGMKEAITDGKTGLIIPILEPLAISNAIIKFQKLALNEKLNLLQNTFSFVEKEFSFMTTLNYIKMYEEL